MRRHTLVKLRLIGLKVGLVLIVVVTIFSNFYQINYAAVPSYLRTKIFGPSVDLVLRSELKSEYKIQNPRSNIRGFPRLRCDCDGWYNRSRPWLNLYAMKTTAVVKATSTCSDEASQFGVNQKVISYSLFIALAKAPKYFLEGLEPNLEKIKLIYPSWQVRIYTNIPVNNHSCSFICKYDFLFWCDIRNIPVLGDLSRMNGRVWRYLPIGDPTVDILMSRDLDSMVSRREREAVAEWEASDKAVHVMRDSHWHKTRILAGLWGFKNYRFKPEVTQKVRATFIQIGRKNQTKFWDQKLAGKHIYSAFKEEVMAHDSYFCGKFPDAVVRPFPTQRIGEEFVGHDERKEIDAPIAGRVRVCPKKCRPTYGQNWHFC